MLGLKRKDLGVWLAYLTMLAVIVPRHEPWNDEAQAWLLARGLSIPQLLLHGLRYESHPALWYLILWLPAHLHLNYAIFCWISASIAAAGIYVFLRLSPFPFYLRAALPFTFFLAYQYAVVARSYVLFPLLCFLIAHVSRKAERRPLQLAVLLALLANVSIHGTLVACTVAAIYGWRLFRSHATIREVRGLAPASAIFLASIALAAFTVFPPRDLTTVATPAVSRVLLRRAGSNDSAQSPLPVASARPATAPQQGGLRFRIARIPGLLSYPISPSHLVAIGLYVLTAAFLARRGQVLLLLPLVVLGMFLSLVYSREWHLGMLWIVLLMVLWIAWNPGLDRSFNFQSGLGGFLFLICLLQLPWTWRAIHTDYDSQYSGAKQTAAYLHTLSPDRRIAGFGPESTATLPYFDRNIFFNQPANSYWLWSTRNTIDNDAATTLATHPDFVVLLQPFSATGRPNDNSIRDLVEADDYHETHRFCGHSYLPGLPDATIPCYEILQPK